MADRELELHGKIGLPEWLGIPAALEARFKQSWTSRGEDLVKSAADAAGLEPAEVGAALAAEDAERQRDLFGRALGRAAEVGEPEYISALGSLVGAALDDARVDHVTYATAQVLKLEPLELRTLWASVAYRAIDPEDGGTVPYRSAEGALYCVPSSSLNAHHLADAENVSIFMALAAIETLSGLGFVRWEPVEKPFQRRRLATGRRGDPVQHVTEYEEPTSLRAKWRSNEWACAVVRMTRPHLITSDDAWERQQAVQEETARRADRPGPVDDAGVDTT